MILDYLWKIINFEIIQILSNDIGIEFIIKGYSVAYAEGKISEVNVIKLDNNKLIPIKNVNKIYKYLGILEFNTGRDKWKKIKKNTSKEPE